jgi:hypothetical protein
MSDYTGKISSQKAAPKTPGLYHCVILQGNFDSSAASEEFFQAFTNNGIEYLRCSKIPLSPASNNDPSIMDKLVRAISGIWARKPNIGAQP